jgi:hypothetical protein
MPRRPGSLAAARRGQRGTQHVTSAATMEPHSARLIVLAKGGVVTAKCTSTDTYTVLLLDLQAAAEFSAI